MIKDHITIDYILNLSDLEPEKLFYGSLIDSKKLYQELVSKYHPDKNKVSGDILSKINVLYDLTIKKIQDGSWEGSGNIEITSLDNKKYIFHYKKSRNLEIGKQYIADKFLAFEVDNCNNDLVENFLKITNTFKFKTNRMKEEFSKYLPSIESIIKTENKNYLILRKTEDLYSLRDILTYFKGILDVKHVAWILSSLYNIACYLKFNDISHQDISLDNYFISPKYHLGALLGGWWYSKKIGSKLIALPSRTINNQPSLLINKISEESTDLNLILLLGRELLGDSYGTKLRSVKSIPTPIINWLQINTNNNAIDIYRNWQELVLPKSFGKREFIEMKIDDKLIY